MGSVQPVSRRNVVFRILGETYGSGGHALVRVVVPAGRDIFTHVSDSNLNIITSQRECVWWERTGASLLFDLDVTSLGQLNVESGGAAHREAARKARSEPCCSPQTCSANKPMIECEEE